MADQHVGVLLIADNPMHARLIQTLLAEDGQPACQVESVDRLAGGLTRLEQGGIDLVLLDLVLPEGPTGHAHRGVD